MTRPILWALATFATIATAATVTGGRLSRIVEAGPPAAARPAPTLAALRADRPMTGQAGREVTVMGDRLGHFLVEAAVDGRRAMMMVDTGASIVALTSRDAAAAGIRPVPSDFNRRISTANGVVSVASVRIRELRIGEIAIRDVDAVVMPNGALGTSLLGMSFLRQLRGFDITGGRLTLRG